MNRFVNTRSSYVFALPAAALIALALTGGLVDARQAQQEERPAISTDGSGSDYERENDPALAWVDPVITGPVSTEYKRQRDAAGCDVAVWPHIPSICFPAGSPNR